MISAVRSRSASSAWAWPARSWSMPRGFIPGCRLVAAADPQPAPREAFSREFGAPAFEDAAQLCRAPMSRRSTSRRRTSSIASMPSWRREAGKHVIVEKPLALTLDECDAIISAVERNGVHLIVGHTHGFDPAVRAMARTIRSGEVGALGLVAMWNYTNFMYRPRRPEELDTSRGGGILFNQIPHQIDTLRVLGGDIRSVRAIAKQLDPARPTEGLASALLQFDERRGRHDHLFGLRPFRSDEFHYWTAESGAPKPRDQHGAARRALRQQTDDEASLRVKNFALGAKALCAAAASASLRGDDRHLLASGPARLARRGADLWPRRRSRDRAAAPGRRSRPARGARRSLWGAAARPAAPA